MVKLEKGNRIRYSVANPKISGKKFTVSNDYEILDVKSNEKGNYAILINDAGEKLAFYQSDIDSCFVDASSAAAMTQFAKEQENLNNVQEIRQSPPPPPGDRNLADMPKAPGSIEVSAKNAAEQEELLRKIEKLNEMIYHLSAENENISKMNNEIRNVNSKLIEEIEVLRNEKSKPDELAQGKYVGIINSILSLDVLNEKASITLVKSSNAGKFTALVKIDDFPSISSTNVAENIEEDISLTVSSAFSENTIRIATIMDFNRKLIELETAKGKALKQAESDTKEDPAVTQGKGKGRGQSAKKDSAKEVNPKPGPADDEILIPEDDDSQVDPDPEFEMDDDYAKRLSSIGSGEKF